MKRHIVRSVALLTLLLGFSLATKPTFVLVLPLLWILGHRKAAALALAGALAFTGLALVLLQQGFAPLARWAEGSLVKIAFRSRSAWSRSTLSTVSGR